MHMDLLSVCLGLNAPQELDRGPSLPCDHLLREGQPLLQWLFRFVPDPGAWDDFFHLCGEKGASEHVVGRRQVSFLADGGEDHLRLP